MKALSVVLILVSSLFIGCGDSTENIEVTKGLKSNWEIAPVLDEFGDPKEGESGIMGVFDGKMSNSATQGGDLKVHVQILDTSLFINFYEYGSSLAQLPELRYVDAKIKLADGEVKTVKNFLFKNTMSDEGELMNLLNTENEPFKMIVDLTKVSGSGSAVYNFELDPTGFKDLVLSINK